VDLRAPDAFNQMYRQELGYVLNTLDRLGAPAGQREDLCHDVFMAAFRKRGDFDPARPLRPWLFGIAYRTMLNVRRRVAAPAGDEGLEAVADPASGPEQAAAAGQAKSALSRAIATLEPDRRAVFILHDLEGRAAPEIARALEIPLNTAYSRLRLARADVLKATQHLREGGAR